MITFTVPGQPQQQGSRKFVGTRSGRHLSIDMNRKLLPWRQEAIAIAQAAYTGPQLLGPVQVEATFVFARPKGHYRTGKQAGTVKDGAPYYKGSTPDTDKCTRALGDALTQSALIKDDAQIAMWIASKVYGERPQTIVTIRELK